MDAHIDRLMMLRTMETNAVGHEAVVAINHHRSGSTKIHEMELGPDWNQTDSPANLRFINPNITFSNEVLIHWNETPITLTHKSGAHTAGIWVIDDAHKVVFVGDSVVLGQPPFFALADLDQWIEELNWLCSGRFENFKIVSARNGLLAGDSIKEMSEFLKKTKKLVDELSESDQSVTKLPAVVSNLLNKIIFDSSLQGRYSQRLTWGLEQYLKRHFSKLEPDLRGEDE
jgi:hypothetical protein